MFLTDAKNMRKRAENNLTFSVPKISPKNSAALQNKIGRNSNNILATTVANTHSYREFDTHFSISAHNKNDKLKPDNNDANKSPTR